MFPSYSSRSFTSVTVVLLLLNALFLYLITDLNNLEVEMAETGFVENLQLVYLGLAAIAFLIGGLRVEGPARMFAIGMSVLMWIFFFREFEIEPTGPVSGYIKSHTFRWHEAIVVVAIAGIYIFRRAQYVRPVIEFVLSRKAWPFYLAAVLILTGEVFEKMHGFTYNEFFEEVLESLSYFMLLCLGVRSIFAQPDEAAGMRTA